MNPTAASRRTSADVPGPDRRARSRSRGPRVLVLIVAAAGACSIAGAITSDAWAQSRGNAPATRGQAQNPPAAKTKKAKPSKQDEARAKAVAAQLRSNRREDLLAGFEAVGAGGQVAQLAEPAASARLSRGLPPDIAVVALQSVAVVGSASSSVAIAPYLRHREVAVRRAAAKALSRTRGEAAASALRVALADPDPMVRGLAATGLGAMGATQFVDDLFVALDHKVPEAAASIGQLCSPEQCERFAAKTGQFGFDVMTSGFDQILFRDPAEISDDLKLAIVGKVREIGTSDAHAFLEGVQGRWPAVWSKRVKQAIDLAVSSTHGAPGASHDPVDGQP